MKPLTYVCDIATGAIGFIIINIVHKISMDDITRFEGMLKAIAELLVLIATIITLLIRLKSIKTTMSVMTIIKLLIGYKKADRSNRIKK